MAGKLFVISAPSGAGKTTLVNALLRDFQGKHPIERVITYTSKNPRPSEVDGIDYHFIAPHEFEARIAEGFFIEWSAAYGTYYGSPRSILDGISQGTSYIAILDRAGARAIIDQVPDAVLIWIDIPSMEALKSRLANRAQDSEEQITKRLGLAKIELEEEAKKPFFHHHILNDSFENAVENLKATIEIFLSASNELKLA